VADGRYEFLTHQRRARPRSTSSHGTPGQAGQALRQAPKARSTARRDRRDRRAGRADFWGMFLPNISAKSAISAIRGVGRPKVLKDGRFEGMDVRAAAAK
jgi:hypothetical protein